MFLFFKINLFIHLFIFGCAGSVAERGLLTVVASLVAEHRV